MKNPTEGGTLLLEDGYWFHLIVPHDHGTDALKPLKIAFRCRNTIPTATSVPAAFERVESGIHLIMEYSYSITIFPP